MKESQILDDKISEVLGSRELGLTKASKFFLLLYFIGYTFIQVFRAHKIVPRWYELNRMPTVHDALANPIKPIVFSGFWDEWILVGAHFTFPIMFSIIVITIALFSMSIGLLFNKPLKGSCGNCECKEDRCENEVVR